MRNAVLSAVTVVIVVAIAVAVAVALMAGPAPAQGLNPEVERRVDAVETFFTRVRTDPRHLAAAQRILSYGRGEPLKADGAWGPSTEERVRQVLTSMSQIRIETYGTDPFQVTEVMFGWLTQITMADIGIGDMPD